MMNEHPISASTLQERAERAGISTQYTGFWGHAVSPSPQVLERALAAMGRHADAAYPDCVVVPLGEAHTIALQQSCQWQLTNTDAPDTPAAATGHGDHASLPADLAAGYYRLHGAGQSLDVLVAPRRCWLPDGLLAGDRWWGITAQMYSLRSARSWGIGDFSDLLQCVRVSAAQGAAFVGVSPLHALRTDRPEQASPYSPSSRLALNVLHIDVTAVPEYLQCERTRALCADPAFSARLEAARQSTMVDYGAVAALKDAALTQLWTTFRDTAWAGDACRGRAFDAFRASHADTLELHARFEAIQAAVQAGDPAAWGWPAWPQALRDAKGPAVAAFAQEHEDAVAYRMWLQWIAHEQLARVTACATELMPIGLYCDLAVGAADGGTDTWADPGLYARGMNVGAPPDPLSTQGQDWGLPPMNPAALAAAGYQPFRRLLSAVMHPAGALRMDHVMGLMRLFWTSPDGGTYVRYPLKALLAVLSIESHRNHCMVIGEDLGNVEPAMRQAMAESALLSYKPLIFERLDHGAFRPPSQWPAQALAVVTTHDLPTLVGFWAADDVAVQHALGWLDTDAHVGALMNRAHDRTHLLAALHAEDLLPAGVALDPHSSPEMTAELAAAVHALLARTPCQLVGVQLEDLTAQREQPNVPGTTEERHPNWRRRMSVSLEQLASHPFFTAITAAVRSHRGSLPRAAPATPPLSSADVPLATYRVQLNAHFTFAQAQAAVPYLHALGVSHLYTSPYLKASAGSTHGYDVTDPTQVNPEIGTDADHAALCATLRRHGMGHVLDTVPNHMGVDDPGNVWWQDVLEHGPSSPHAATFDIEWNPSSDHTRSRVLLPVLGDHFGQVLEAAQLQVRYDADAGRFQVAYWERALPLDPLCYAELLAAAPWPVAGPQVDAQDLASLHSLIDAFAALAPQNTPDPALRAARVRDSALHRQRLAELSARLPWVQDGIAAALARVNGTAGDSQSFDLLEGILQRQAYRLADWRVAGDDINYRRFFDVNALAAVRMQEPAVFDAAHAQILRWLAEDKVQGLRIDHPDGLADPAQYFERLQQRYQWLRQTQGLPPRALYVVVEKIMAEHEPLPQDWQVHGGTGYRFAALVNGVFVDTQAEQRFDEIYERFTGEADPFEEAACVCKRHIIETSLFSDLNWLVDTLAKITRADRRVCDFTRNKLRVALVEVATRFPVYRTYVLPGKAEPSDTDRQHIAWAISAARRQLGTTEGGVLAYLQRVLLGEDGPAADLRADFVRRWQQFTAPVMAKAVEDTLFYRYVRLVSLNDVGAEPRRFGLPVSAFHQANQQRSRYAPHGMLATSTHDSKRSEDVRARLNVLSELPEAWGETVLALQTAAERFESVVDDATVPTPHDRWNLFQAMAGVWPAGGTDAAGLADLRERIQRYMVKAMREAKLQTNWLFPNEPYENAVAQYIDKALASERFVGILQDWVDRIAPYGYRNSLCQVALKLTAPGVPDIYQGCERWNFSLVDPDNRREVDFAAMARDLAPINALYAHGNYPTAKQWSAVLGSSAAMPDAAKQLTTWRLLHLRKQLPALFRDAIYLPLTVEGAAAAHVIAFARIHEGAAVLVVCSRLLAVWEQTHASQWGDTCVLVSDAHPALGKPGQWVDVCTGRATGNGMRIPLASLISSGSGSGAAGGAGGTPGTLGASALPSASVPSALPYAVLVAAENAE
ncbi:MAG: malto-oligosyltrehalose synthase [Comamonadaceae bacterium]|nr:MAG: malto-oligosyltrehalose synthase [Comamonadaceae bacterium]